MNSKPHVAVVGATGAVGIEMIKTLEKRNFPVGNLTLLASARSVGKKLMFRGEEYTVNELTKNSFSELTSHCLARAVVSRRSLRNRRQGRLYRHRQLERLPHGREVPLVIPEINASDVKTHEGIIANPNCTTAVTLMALYPLHRAFSVKRIFASSYQRFPAPAPKLSRNFGARLSSR